MRSKARIYWMTERSCDDTREPSYCRVNDMCANRLATRMSRSRRLNRIMYMTDSLDYVKA